MTPHLACETEASAVQVRDVFAIGFMAAAAYRRLAELDLPPLAVIIIVVGAFILAWFVVEDDDHFTPRR